MTDLVGAAFGLFSSIDLTMLSVGLINFILALVAVEYIVLAGRRLLTGCGMSVLNLTANLLSGALLLICLQQVLNGYLGIELAGLLIASGLAHGLDLWLRGRETKRRAGGVPTVNSVR
ncbi:MAG: hypothetical protein AAGG72_00530 [Pseudomonadota bacterium]